MLNPAVVFIAVSGILSITRTFRYIKSKNKEDARVALGALFVALCFSTWFLPGADIY